jgi:hypothetical protein
MAPEMQQTYQVEVRGEQLFVNDAVIPGILAAKTGDQVILTSHDSGWRVECTYDELMRWAPLFVRQIEGGLASGTGSPPSGFRESFEDKPDGT